MQTLSLFPAYGRDYKNKKDLLADWNAGKDFKTVHGQYTSVDETRFLKELGITAVIFYYTKRMKVHMVKL